MSSSSPASLALMGFSGGELLIVLAIILLLFGGSKLPSLAKGLGQSIKEFKKAAKDDEPPSPGKAEPKKPDAEGSHGAN
jgi:sec-independent protein translocase protein TatA